MAGLTEYGIGKWDSESWGNHRALVQVCPDMLSARAVLARLPWRRRDADVQRKGVFVRFSGNGQALSNVLIQRLDREWGEIIFEPGFGAGVYEIYYMPYGGQTRAPYPVIHYLPARDFSCAQWRNAVLQESETLPQAELLRFEACDELHSFFPMEVIVTQKEVEQLCQSFVNKPFLLFGEQRELSIRMDEFLPAHWVQEGRGPFQPLPLQAFRGEYLVFQVGLYAHRRDLQVTGFDCSGFIQERAKQTRLQTLDLTCFQLEGTDCYGQEFSHSLELKVGRIQALWFGLTVDLAALPGTYNGKLMLHTAQGAESLPVELTVSGESIANSGDDQPLRMTRLRWLNSRLGWEPTVTKPFTPVQLFREPGTGVSLRVLGRELQLDALGLPQRIFSYFTAELTDIGNDATSILSEPCRFVVEQNNRELSWQETGLHLQQENDSCVLWQNTLQTAALSWDLQGSLEFDGCLSIRCLLSADQAVDLSDVRLEIPLLAQIVKYRLGLGYQGQETQQEIDWKWDVTNKSQDALWLGKENAGLQVALRDDDYRRPLNTNFYQQQPLLSSSWDNGGRGGIRLRRSSNGNYLLCCYSGARTLAAGASVSFVFRFLVTPFKPFDAYKQWNTRFLHEYTPPIAAKTEGATLINIHHAKPINPFINYPFLRPEQMRQFVEEAHRLGLKVCVYYTVRELSNHAPEIFALRSLGAEIFSTGPGGGHSWLQEHFGSDYIPAWHVFSYGCVAVVNSGTSRWHNFYVEGIHWLAKNVGIDGVYIDDLAFDRRIMQRVRRVLDAQCKDAIIDMHSANQFNLRDGFANSINLYMEHLPYLDRIWFGEYFHYEKGPDYWMSEVAGLPFGVGGEMLQDGGNLWRGLLYGMTARYPHTQTKSGGGDPRPIWALWRDFGIEHSQMLGYWAPSCPVCSNSPRVLITCYLRRDCALLVAASWEEKDFDLELNFDWQAFAAGGAEGFGSDTCELYAPYMKNVQTEQLFRLDQRIPVKPAEGAILILRSKV